MRTKIFLQGLISCLIVAFSQPSFIPWLCPITAAFGYALFWHAIRDFPFWQRRFWIALGWYSCISLIQLSWMSSIEYQGFYILFVWLGFSLGVGAQFGLLTLLVPINRPLKLPRILAIASMWTLFEWSRFYFLCGYTWNLSGLALSGPYAIQLASVFGILGLSFWVIFANLLGLRAALQKRRAHYAIWIGAICFPYLFGVWHFNHHQKRMGATAQEPFTCLLVQTGLLPAEKIYLDGKGFAFISPYVQWQRILLLVKKWKDQQPDIIVLPESAVPFSSGKCVYDKKRVDQIFFDVFGPIDSSIFPETEVPYQNATTQKVSNAYWVQALSNLFKSDIIIGLDHEEESGEAYSSAFYVKPFKTILDRYDKRVLVPLAEYLPLPFLAPLVKSYGVTDFFTPGDGAKIFEGKLPMSVSICYEETFPQNVREGRLKGAKMLINVTNDGWYPFTLLPSQHYEHAKFRAVENGVPLLRACNSGISAAVDSLGRPIGELDQSPKERRLHAGALFAEINPYEYPTLFTVWGNGGILSLCFMFIGTFVLLKKRYQW